MLPPRNVPTSSHALEATRPVLNAEGILDLIEYIKSLGTTEKAGP